MATSFASQPSSALDFVLMCNSSTTSTLTFVFVRQPAVWQEVRGSFIASARDDVTVGSSSISIFHNNEVTGNLNNNNFVKAVETGPIRNFQTSIARAFLNGLRLSSTSTAIQVQTDARKVLASGVEIVIYTGPSCIVELVHVSYIILSPNASPDLSMSGSSFVATKLTGLAFHEAKNSNHLPNPFISGITKIASPLALGLRSNIDNDFILAVEQKGPAIDIVLSYAFITTPPRQICDQYKTERHANYEHCLAACPADSYVQTFRDGGLKCQRCSPKLNMVLNSDRNGCVCAAGFTLANGVCLGSQPQGQNIQQNARPEQL